MNRLIIFITCLFSTLLLIPLHGECSEPGEYEPETEIECVVMTSSAIAGQNVNDPAGATSQAVYIHPATQPSAIIHAGDMVAVSRISLNILLCNLRE